MGPILNKNKNKELSIEEIEQNENNNNTTHILCNPEEVDTPYLKKKRKIPDGGGEEHINQLNRNVPSETISQLKQKLEENEKKAKDLKEEIIKKQKELDELNEVNKNMKNELDNLEKYKEIKSNLVYYLDSQIQNYENINESKDEIINIMNDYWNNNKKNLLPLYQSEINALEKLYQKTHLQTIIIKKEKFENENSSVSEEAMNENKNLKEHKFPHAQFTNNNNNKSTKFDQYSFKCLTKNLNHKILRGTKEVSFGIELENNGNFPWPRNETFLLTDETKSTIKSEKINLAPLNPKVHQLFDIKFKNMDKFKPGIYKNNLSFYAKGKSFGNNITINIELSE